MDKSLFTPAMPDALNSDIIDSMGELAPTPHGVYVEDDIYLKFANRQRFKQALPRASRDMTRCHDPISWEKLHELLNAPINCILSLIRDLHRMMVGAQPAFIAATVTLLRTTW
jgi:hypothetical protein